MGCVKSYDGVTEEFNKSIGVEVAEEMRKSKQIYAIILEEYWRTVNTSPANNQNKNTAPLGNRPEASQFFFETQKGYQVLFVFGLQKVLENLNSVRKHS